MNVDDLKKSGTKEIMVGLLASVIILAGLFYYGITEPQRIDTAAQDQMAADLHVAMQLYAQNCVVCHGIDGKGIGAVPPLDKAALKESDPAALFKIISRGLFKTAMPAWNKEDGGPLSDYQIDRLVSLIRFGDWSATHDMVVNMGLAPTVPMSTEANPEILSALSAMEGGEILVKGITLFAKSCVACHGADGLGTSLAPAVNSPQVREKSADTIERTIRLGVPGTLMAGWENSLAADDVSALVYLVKQWDRVPTGAIPVSETPIPVTAESLALGKDLYSRNCSPCHGPEGQGRGQRIPSLNVKSFLQNRNDRALEQIITNGVPGTPMPAWGERMTAAEIQAVVGFLRSWEATAPEMAEPIRGGGPWWQTGNQGTAGRGNVQGQGGQGQGQGRGRGQGGQGQGQNQTGAQTGQTGTTTGTQGGQGQGQGQNQTDAQGGQGHQAGGQTGQANATAGAQGGHGQTGGTNAQGQPQSSMDRLQKFQEQQQPSLLQTLMEWKVLTLLAIVAIFAFVLIGVAIAGLKRTSKLP